MNMQTCLYLKDLDVKLEQNPKTRLFTVKYGLQISRRLDYETAAAELGACIMHALACDYQLDNEPQRKRQP